MEQCCNKKPVFTLTGREKLCKKHFLSYFEKKVRKTIRIYNLISKKENILVAASGGKDSTVALYLLNRIIKNKKVNIEALFIDLSIGSYTKQNKKNILEIIEKQISREKSLEKEKPKEKKPAKKHRLKQKKINDL